MGRDRTKENCLNIDGIPIEEVIKAGRAMVIAFAENEMLWDAVDEVKEQFPSVSTDTLMALWVGVNCRDKD